MLLCHEFCLGPRLHRSVIVAICQGSPVSPCVPLYRSVTDISKQWQMVDCDAGQQTSDIKKSYLGVIYAVYSSSNIIKSGMALCVRM